MAFVRGKDTKPELKVRRYLHAAGLRFRFHARDLPGRPDVVFRSRRVALFVHGCFWHRHGDFNCKLARLPKSRQDFWEPKLAANGERDIPIIAELRKLGWTVEVVWECDLGPATLQGLAQHIRSTPMVAVGGP